MLSIVQEEPTIFEEEKEQKNPNLNKDLSNLLKDCSQKCTIAKQSKKNLKLEISK